MIRITGVRLEITESEDDLIEKVRRKYNLKNVSDFKITKKSVDARKKNDIHYVYAVDLCAAKEDALAVKYKEIQTIERKPYVFP
ncbi:MAG: hypothetical protein IJL81_00610, partial [Clostridia bacterium]|nr:hypothetical protein [Clostridia bacterium]